jgi:hypothetical protein
LMKSRRVERYSSSPSFSNPSGVPRMPGLVSLGIRFRLPLKEVL